MLLTHILNQSTFRQHSQLQLPKNHVAISQEVDFALFIPEAITMSYTSLPPHTTLSSAVIICTYQRRHLLEQCLNSWSQSKQLPDQFIVVDASPDAAQYRDELLEKFSALFSASNSHYILADKPGLTYQRNLGLRHLKTDIVCFADDDTFVSHDYLTKILEVFQADTQKTIGGVNGTATGQFDNSSQKYTRLFRNHVRHHFGQVAQRIRIPANQTKLHKPLAPELQSFPLIHIDRLWGANMNYRTELIRDSGFDENFQRYGLFEDVDLSVRVGKTHKLVCRLDALINHDDTLGQSTRPKDAQYFLASWINSAYIIEKLFPCAESRNAHRRFFELLRLYSAICPEPIRERKLRTLGNTKLFDIANVSINELQQCNDQEELGAKFQQLQTQIISIRDA